MTEAKPRVAVVVVTYNGAPWIDACLASLQQQDGLAQAIVVDNASSDGTADWVARHHPSTWLLREPANLGFGAGNNRGISLALQRGFDYVLLLNQDAYLLSNTLAPMLAFMDEQPQFGVCSPVHCSPDASRLDPRTFHNYLAHDAAEFLMDAALGQAQAHYEIPGVNAAVWLLRAEVFRRVGGFDPLFFMYGEDDDLLTRFQHHGVRFALLARLRVVHQRQSPPSAGSGRAVRVRRLAARLEARWMAAMKRPRNSMIYMGALLLSRGLLRPLADLVVDRNGEQFEASLRAFGRLLRRLPSIRRHARLLAQPGAHFL